MHIAGFYFEFDTVLPPPLHCIYWCFPSFYLEQISCKIISCVVHALLLRALISICRLFRFLCVCVCAVSTIPNEYLSTRRSLFHVEFKPTEWEIHFIGFVVHSCVHVLTHYCRDAEFELNKNRWRVVRKVILYFEEYYVRTEEIQMWSRNRQGNTNRIYNDILDETQPTERKWLLV